MTSRSASLRQYAADGPAAPTPTACRCHRAHARLTALTCLVVLGLCALAPRHAAAATRCVGPTKGCAATLQSALDGAQDGDTIRLAAESFAGGVTVTKSVTLVGAGQGRTVIRGGGPVLTIGTVGDPAPPTVSIRDLTVTGGRTTSSPESNAIFGQDGVFALGGGIDIPPGPIGPDNATPGATVTLTRTTITDNAAGPSAIFPTGCAVGQCFAFGGGGGIANSGALTVLDSIIRDNRVGSATGLPTPVTDADGGAIVSLAGTVTVLGSRIEDNHTTASGPNARFAEGGGMLLEHSDLTLRDSFVTDNSATLAAQLGNGIDHLANSGAIHLTDSVAHATIAHTTITGNTVRATNTVGDAIAFVGGVAVDSPVDFTMTADVVADNSASAETLGTSTGLAHADSGGLQLYGAMTATAVHDNTVTATSAHGDSEAWAGGMWVLFGDVADSRIADNRLLATSPTGAASARGAGALIDKDPEIQAGGLTLTRSSVDANTGLARGRTALGQGGGLFDTLVSDFGPFGGPLALINSRVTANALTGSPAATLQGGGLFTDRPFTQTNSVIALNTPDQCAGTACPTTTTGPGTLTAARAPRRLAHPRRDASSRHGDPHVHPPGGWALHP